jgi:hypothetical protein
VHFLSAFKLSAMGCANLTRSSSAKPGRWSIPASSRSEVDFSMSAGRVAAVELSEMAGCRNGDQQSANSKRGNVRDGMNIECSHLKNEEVADDDIEPSPKDIHGR